MPAGTGVRFLFGLLAALSLLISGAPATADDRGEEIVVRVGLRGEIVDVSAELSIAATRQVILSPLDRFESCMIRGNLRRYQGTTRLETSGDRTRVVYSAEAVPDTFLPITLGMSLIESETREHYAEIRNEVMRRKR